MESNQTTKILEIVSTLKEASEYLNNDTLPCHPGLLDDMAAAVNSIDVLFQAAEGRPLPGNAIFLNVLSCIQKEPAKLNLLKPAYMDWEYELKQNLTVGTYKNKTERSFHAYIDLVRNNDFNSLVQISANSLASIKKENPMLYYRLIIENKGWYFENNWLDGFEGPNNSLIQNRLTVLKENTDEFLWLYRHLADERSRKTLTAILDNWIYFRLDEINKIEDKTFISCFDEDILQLGDNEIYVDAGAFTGDTVAAFLDISGGRYHHIYTYEISRETHEILCKNLKDIPRITNYWRGVSDKKGQLKLKGVKGAFHGNKLSEEGLYTVETVALDQDIKGPVTFLKIDVEGVDKEALQGARQKIITYRPKIVVDCYHKLKDIIDVLRLIYSFDNSYRFYLRQPEVSEVPKFATSYCIYAIPDDQKRS